MKSYRLFNFLFLLTIVAGAWAACGTSYNVAPVIPGEPVPPGEEKNTIGGPPVVPVCGTLSRTTITNSGFDFSTGSSCLVTAEEDCDGKMVNFVPFGDDTSTSDKPLWFQTLVSDTENRIADLGDTLEDAITSEDIPDTWPEDSPEILEDHFYILEAQDGYAYFEVLELGEVTGVPSSWTADICYSYSASGDFGL